ncbi:MAG: hypothetical protein F4Z31_02340 [Gemmatimonadetes bacterium]|nr:hypothetical protein [Gemmatimonadota bacterium]
MSHRAERRCRWPWPGVCHDTSTFGRTGWIVARRHGGRRQLQTDRWSRLMIMGEHPRIAAALDRLAARRSDPGDGIWLEDEVAAAGPDIREWDLEACWRWKDWPDREERFPGSSPADDGIDAVGVRRSDGGLVAIQCKARKLDDTGTGNPIGKDELDSFGHHASSDEWEERWLVTNGNAPLSAPAARSVKLSGKTIKVVNFATDLEAQAAAAAVNGDCPHCAEDASPGAVRSKSCMQDEAVSESVATLRAHVDSTTGGSPRGRARGKIVLPCGTGKTRISLRIVEELCGAGDTAVVLCPSIALVAQLRREYLVHGAQPIRSLSVCSDQTAGHLAEGGAEPLPGLGGSKTRISKPAEERHLDAFEGRSDAGLEPCQRIRDQGPRDHRRWPDRGLDHVTRRDGPPQCDLRHLPVQSPHRGGTPRRQDGGEGAGGR